MWPPHPRMPTALELLDRVDPVLSAAKIVKDYLNRMPPPPEKLESVSVTKLLNPGQAYYDVVNPLAEEVGAFQKRMAGTGAHEMIEGLLGLPSEQTLDGKDVPGEPSLDGIRGKLDAYVKLPDGTYVPVEIKNVRSGGRPSSSHVEQLAMYCAMLSSDRGLLVRVQRNDRDASSTLLPPLTMSFPDIPGVKREMVRRRDLIREAVAKRDPSILPACAYSMVKCKYREAGVCNCRERAPFEPVIEQGVTWVEAPEFLDTVKTHVEERKTQEKERGSAVPRGLTTFQMLIPRKLYFEAAEAPVPEKEEADPETVKAENVEKAVEGVNKKGLEAELYLAIKRANKDRVSQAQALVPEFARTTITAVDGKPLHVKVRMVRNPIRPTVSELAGSWGAPEDVQRLAVQALLLGAIEARLYVWNWRLEGAGEKLQVFDLRFKPGALAALGEYGRALPHAIQAALSSGDPNPLPLCPRWMCPKCEYREKCRPDETAPA